MGLMPTTQECCPEQYFGVRRGRGGLLPLLGAMCGAGRGGWSRPVEVRVANPSRVSPEREAGDEGLVGERGQILGSESTSVWQLPPPLRWACQCWGRARMPRQRGHREPPCSDAQTARPLARLLLCN